MFLYSILDSAMLILKIRTGKTVRLMDTRMLIPFFSVLLENIMKNINFLSSRYIETIYLAVNIILNEEKRELYNYLGDSFLGVIIENKKIPLLKEICKLKFLFYTLHLGIFLCSFIIFTFLDIIKQSIYFLVGCVVCNLGFLLFYFLIYQTIYKKKKRSIHIFGTSIKIFQLNLLRIYTTRVPFASNYEFNKAIGVFILVDVFYIAFLTVKNLFSAFNITLIIGGYCILLTYVLFQSIFIETLQLIIFVIISAGLLSNNKKKIYFLFLNNFFLTFILSLIIKSTDLGNNTIAIFFILLIYMWINSFLFIFRIAVPIFNRIILKKNLESLGFFYQDLAHHLDIKIPPPNFIHSKTHFDPTCKDCIELSGRLTTKKVFNDVNIGASEFEIIIDKLNNTVTFDYQLKNNLKFKKLLENKEISANGKIVCLKNELTKKLFKIYPTTDKNSRCHLSFNEELISLSYQQEESSKDLENSFGIETLKINFNSLKNGLMNEKYSIDEYQVKSIFPENEEIMFDDSFETIIEKAYQKSLTRSEDDFNNSEIFGLPEKEEESVSSSDESENSIKNNKNDKNDKKNKKSKKNDKSNIKKQTRYVWSDSLSQFQLTLISSDSLSDSRDKIVTHGELKSLNDNYLKSVIIETIKGDSKLIEFKKGRVIEEFFSSDLDEYSSEQ